MLITNTAANGLNRAALQSNPRWAGDRVFVAQAAYNNWRAEVFQVDPDEMPEIDSQTRIQGVNVEARALAQQRFPFGGFGQMSSPRSSRSLFANEPPNTSSVAARWFSSFRARRSAACSLVSPRGEAATVAEAELSSPSCSC